MAPHGLQQSIRMRTCNGNRDQGFDRRDKRKQIDWQASGGQLACVEHDGVQRDAGRVQNKDVKPQQK